MLIFHSFKASGSTFSCLHQRLLRVDFHCLKAHMIFNYNYSKNRYSKNNSIVFYITRGVDIKNRFTYTVTLMAHKAALHC